MRGLKRLVLVAAIAVTSYQAAQASSEYQPPCPTEDSCQARVDYRDGKWYLIVTPDVP